MPLRVRLILAFLLLSVVPLGAVTVYSYVGNRNALRAAAAREADQLAGELKQRMQAVTAQLSDRVEQLMDISASAEPVVRTTETSDTADTSPAPKMAKAKTPKTPTPAASAAPEPADTKSTLDTQVADALGEAAMLLNAVELQGLRGFGPPRGGRPPDGSRGRMPPPNAGGAVAGRGVAAAGGGNAAAPGMSVPNTAPVPAPGGVTGSALTGPVAPAAPVAPGTEPPRGDFRGDPNRRFRPRGEGGPPPYVAGDRGQSGVGRGQPPDAADAARGFRPPGPPPPPGAPWPGMPLSPDAPADATDKIKIDLAPIRRDLFRQIVPEGSSFADMTPEQRQRLASEVNQRMLGIVEGIRLGAVELQKKADAAKRKAQTDAALAQNTSKATGGAQTKAATIQRKAAISGNRLDVTLEQNGKVVRAVNAEINLPQVLLTVFSSMTRGQGEVPFAVGNDGKIYTPTDADRAVVERLKPMSRPIGTSNVDDWIVVTTNDPTGSGLKLGIARPVGDSLNELRLTAGRNAALGLLLIGLAIVGVVPLSGRLTRNLSRLTEGVQRIAHGDYAARVTVKSHDEIGQLATAFNQMAADVEAHQRTMLEQERLKRELELGRQIQHDMLPQAPLTLGLTQVVGVSVPAREVGGDFFNYFALPNGHVALLVGDVSGKGVGAALLMANIQASLRTRLGLGQQLSAIADEIDRDIETNSPGQMYATMFLGILDPASRTLRYINAGHHPQFVLGPRGMERMSATGLPIGLVAGRGYTERSVTMAAGDLIVFYTDGVVETESETEEMFGSERFESLLSACAGRTAEDVLRTVEQALKEFRGMREPFDDATLMAVRVG